MDYVGLREWYYGMANSGIDGLAEALEKMKNMRVQTKNKHIRKALKKALVPIRDQVKANARNIDDPKTVEKVWKNVQIQSGKSKKGEFRYRVGIKGGAKQSSDKKRGTGGNTWYFRLIEFGTRFFPAIPFIRTAFEMKKGEAIEIFIYEIRKGILEEVRS